MSVSIMDMTSSSTTNARADFFRRICFFLFLTFAIPLYEHLICGKIHIRTVIYQKIRDMLVVFNHRHTVDRPV